MAKKKLKSHIWPGHTELEMRAINLLRDAFGKLTYVSLEKFEQVWRPVEGASWPRCPMCMTWWEREKWPRCQWCRFIDKGRDYEYE